jgi:hypothetical protein
MKKCKTKVLLFCLLVLLFGSTQATMGVVAPTNDTCACPAPVGNVTNQAFDTTNATFDGPGLGGMTGPNIWYIYTATCNGIVTVSLCGSHYDTRLAVYRGSNCSLSASDLIRKNDDFCDVHSQVSFGGVAGNQYLIEVGGYSDRAGQGVLTITCESATCPPANDDCSHAQSIGDVSHLPFDTRCATFDGSGDCITSPNIWYLYNASCTGQATISLCGGSYDSMVAVYNGSNCPPSSSNLIDCNDDYCGYDAQVTINVTAGHNYLIEVGGYDNWYGEGVLSINCQGTPGDQHPVNDNCSNAKPVGDVTNMSFNTTLATFDGPGLCMTSPNIWYCYTASCTGTATVSLCGSSFDTKLAVYNGCTCNPTSARLIGCNDDSCGSQSQLSFSVTAGNQYLIEVGGYQQAVGQGVLSISCQGQPGPQPVVNDNCNNAKPVGDVTNMSFDTTLATFDGPGLCMTSPNIWYCYTATCTGTATVNLCGSSFDTKLAVYSGCQCNPTSARLLGCNDDSCGNQSQLSFSVIAGNQYLIEVGGYQQAKGAGVLNISCSGQAPSTAILDFGDAPDSSNNYGRNMTAYTSGTSTVQAHFPTVFNDGGTGPYGPFHRRPLEAAYLGKGVSLETEADIGTDQDGVTNIDPPTDTANKDGYDDGVTTIPLSLPNCDWAALDYKVTVVAPGTDLWVNVWFDWNRDGDWDDDTSTDPTLNCSKGIVSEWAVKNQLLFNLPAGLNTITTPAFLCWHPQSGQTKIWMRITLSEQPWKGGSSPGKLGNGGSGPQTGYTYGETEDYFFTPTIPSQQCDLCRDLNGDGQINYQDLSLLVNQWIAQCLH